MSVPFMIFLKIGQSIMPRWKYNVVCFLELKIILISAILKYDNCFSQSHMCKCVKITHYCNLYEKYIPQLGAKIIYISLKVIYLNLYVKLKTYIFGKIT